MVKNADLLTNAEVARKKAKAHRNSTRSREEDTLSKLKKFKSSLLKSLKEGPAEVNAEELAKTRFA